MQVEKGMRPIHNRTSYQTKIDITVNNLSFSIGNMERTINKVYLLMGKRKRNMSQKEAKCEEYFIRE